MYAECINGVTEKMKRDPLVKIISDGAVFLLTTKNNISTYPELKFKEVNKESLKAYSKELKGLL